MTTPLDEAPKAASQSDLIKEWLALLETGGVGQLAPRLRDQVVAAAADAQALPMLAARSLYDAYLTDAQRTALRHWSATPDGRAVDAGIDGNDELARWRRRREAVERRLGSGRPVSTRAEELRRKRDELDAQLASCDRRLSELRSEKERLEVSP